ncbi:MAG: right-handed parallel beta-helix repeat-containing protein [Nibricoccus sp.]
MKFATLSLGLLLSSMAAATATAVEIWVSPLGDDTQSGASETPLASPAAAIRKAREIRRTATKPLESDIRILLRGGTYSLDRAIILRPEDSGTAVSRTSIEAATGETPVLSGGVTIGGWRLADDTPSTLPSAAKSRIWVTDTPIFNGRPLEFRQLWINGLKATRARTPNGEAMERLTSWNREKETAGIPPALVDTIKNPAGIEMIVAQQWAVGILRINTLTYDTAETRATFHQPESKIEFEHPWPQPILKQEGGSGAFFLANSIEFLDEPGEWYQDLANNRIYYWPRKGEDLTRDEVVAPALENLLEVAGNSDRPVSNISLKGIHFSHTTWLRPSLAGHVPLQAGMFITEAYKLRPPGTPDWRSLDNQTWTGRAPAAVPVTGAQHLRFERCRFEHMAMSGLDLVNSTRDNVIEGCVFRDLGGNGIQMGSFQGAGIESHLPYAPADDREICARERIANNVIADCANEDWGCVAIVAGYVRDTTIEHNEISNVSYMGVSLGWGWTRTPNVMRKNRVHANRFERVATRMCDDAAIYTLSAQPGTVVSENSIGEIKMSPYVDRPDHWFYLYTDEGSSFITVRDNWCPEEKFLQNATGPGNVWENNGPKVSEKIRAAAGLEPAFRDLSVLLPKK